MFDLIVYVLSIALPTVDEAKLGSFLNLEIQYFTSILVSNLEGVLHDIVRVLIIEHFNQTVLRLVDLDRNDLIKYVIFTGIGCILYTTFDHV